MKTFAAYALAFVVVSASTVSILAQSPAPPPEKLFKKLVTAVRTNSYDDFVGDGDRTFKTAMTKPLFGNVTSQLGARLAAGYSTAYLTALRQGGFTIHLWKISYMNGSDDTLARLVVTDGKVSGF